MTPETAFDIASRLTPTECKIFKIFLAHPEGLTDTQLTDLLYADDPDGGPLFDTVKVFLCRMAKRLPQGYRIERSKGGGVRRLMGPDTVLPALTVRDILSPKKLAIYELVKSRPGLHDSEIATRLEIESIATVSVTIYQMRFILAQIGETIGASRPSAGYRVTKLAETRKQAA